jgi:hypothetical protein
MLPRLADAIFWIAVACCTIAQLAIVRSAVVSPSTAAERAGGGMPVSRPTLRRAAEIAWAVLPGFALAAVLVFTRRAMR